VISNNNYFTVSGVYLLNHLREPMKRKKYTGSALSLSKGVKQPPSVNPNLKKIKRKELSVDEYINGIRKNDRSILSRAITLVESNLPEHTLVSRKIVEACLPYTGKSIRIGITGIPGVGKSTFIETFGTYVTAKRHKLAVLAIDPSSERSKGSILGDKTRMEMLSARPDTFIRPSPSAGTLGGVARKTRESILLCEAAGYDIIFIETVGVGQSEVAVHSMVDFFLLLLLAGAGDELQGIKRGIIEMADLLVITKADGSNVMKANRAATEFNSALHMFPPADSGWNPIVLTCSAQNNQGMDAVWDKILEYAGLTKSNGFFEKNRNEQALHWMKEAISEALTLHFYKNEQISKKLKKLQTEVLRNKISPFIAATRILNFYFRNV